MIPDGLRRAVRSGPEAFPSGEPGWRALAFLVHWRLWATMTVVTVGFGAAAHAHVSLPSGWAFLATFVARLFYLLPFTTEAQTRRIFFRPWCWVLGHEWADECRYGVERVCLTCRKRREVSES